MIDWVCNSTLWTFLSTIITQSNLKLYITIPGITLLHSVFFFFIYFLLYFSLNEFLEKFTKYSGKTHYCLRRCISWSCLNEPFGIWFFLHGSLWWLIQHTPMMLQIITFGSSYISKCYLSLVVKTKFHPGGSSSQSKHWFECVVGWGAGGGLFIFEKYNV